MNVPSPVDVTELLMEWSNGNRAALDRLMPLVYDELHRLAARQIRKESQGHTRPLVHFIVEAQRELATERGWAFWDQYRAMGGGGSMWSWIKAGLGSQDMFHPTGRGGNVLGKWEYLALMEAYEQYKARP